jgi:hypothetical protein
MMVSFVLWFRAGHIRRGSDLVAGVRFVGPATFLGRQSVGLEECVLRNGERMGIAASLHYALNSVSAYESFDVAIERHEESIYMSSAYACDVSPTS